LGSWIVEEEKQLLAIDVNNKISEIKKADLLVGIPSYNNASTIRHVVRAVQAGLYKYFPGCRSVIVNSDGGSTDGTPEIVKNATLDENLSLFIDHTPAGSFRITTPYHGIPGKGSAFRTIFEIAGALGVSACAVVDSDLRSITPEWIELLLKPIFEAGHDFVAPLYKRHKYDGTITNSIIYPLTRALYGKRIRQPIGGDFGLSGRLAEYYLTKNIWDTDVAKYGIDIWITTTAIANGFKVCQSYLGAKIHDPKDPGSDLSAMLSQVVGSAFNLMETYSIQWRMIRGSETVPEFGFEYEVGLEPVKVNLDRMLEKFRLGVSELSPIWEQVLSGDIINHLRIIAKSPTDEFNLPIEIWADIVYSFALAYHHKVMNSGHLLKSLTSLYLGRVASFVLETTDSSGEDVEARIEDMCLIFENKKKILLNNW
jgi:glycosyltransferase involved in cell wall biosynthesis